MKFLFYVRCALLLLLLGGTTNALAQSVLVVKPGSTLTVNGATIKIGGKVISSGDFDAINGTVEMNGSSTQSLSGSMFKSSTIKNLTVNNTAGVSVSPVSKDTLKISGTLSFGNTSTLLNTGDNITLLSSAATTANVGKVGSNNTINGKFTVERFINIGPVAGQHKKSWQLLAAATTGQTIKNSWMEGGLQPTAPNGYGTWLTGAGGIPGGFDVYSGTPSMKTYVPTSNSWVTVPNPSTTMIHNQSGYMVFVRGDRSVFNFSGANSSPLPTILRTSGELLTGDQPLITLPAGKYQAIGNPYASAVDFTKIDKSDGVDNKFYVWDPYLSGSYSLGGYQTLCRTNNWIPSPGGTPIYPNFIPKPYIQSGQAFLVFTTGTNPSSDNYSLHFTEEVKMASTPPNSYARPMARTGENKRQFFRVSLYIGPNANDLIADGNVVAFDEVFSNEIDGDDALKLLNEGENFGLERDGKLLVIEARLPVQNTDTIYYSFSNLEQRNYQLRFAPENMETSNLQAYLLDKFLNTTVPISLSGNSFIDISITEVSGSAAADRFKVIFRPMAALPVTFTSIKATQNNEDILVEWKVENESNLAYYEVEKSLDGINFSMQTNLNALNGSINHYNWLDKNPKPGNNYYRIHSVDLNGRSNYTGVVKVLIGKANGSIVIYPNPIINGNIQLHLFNQPSGIYGIRLVNQLGQAIRSKKIHHITGGATETIQMDNQLAEGIYHLEITKPGGEVEVIRVKN